MLQGRRQVRARLVCRAGRAGAGRAKYLAGGAKPTPRGRLDTQGWQNAMHSNERFVFDDHSITFCTTAAPNISVLVPYVFDPRSGYVPPDSR